MAVVGVRVGLGLLVKAVLFLSVCKGVWTKTFGADVQALVLFKNAVEPDSIGGTTCLGSWNMSLDPCDVRFTTQFVCGIRCDSKTRGEWRITSLTLDGVGYRGFLHPSIGNLTELTEIELAGNGFHGVIPESITWLKKLTRLDLSGNSFSGPLPNSLGWLTSLTMLSLSRNLLTGSLPGSLNSLENLLRLDVSYNSLGGFIPPLGGLIKLYNLDLSSNSFSGIIPSELPQSLSQLILKSNLLTGGIPRSLMSLRGLGVLDLSSNRLSGGIDGSLFSHPELQQVNLSNNSFASIAVPNVSSLDSQLVAVDIGYNRISGSLPSNFSTVQSLAALSLRYNSFRGPIPVEYGAKAADGVKPLVRLYLDGNYLRGGIPSQFLKLSPDKITGSFADNCLERCPSSLLLCNGTQKPASLCRRAYRRGSLGRPHIP